MNQERFQNSLKLNSLKSDMIELIKYYAFIDRQFIHPTSVFAKFQSENNGRRNNVYLYYFNRKVAKKYSADLEAVFQPEEFLGASHAGKYGNV